MLFNFSVSLVGVLAIYPSGVMVTPGQTKLNTGYDPSGTVNYNIPTSDQTTTTSLMTYFAGPILAAIIGGVIAASISSFVLRTPMVAAVSYGLFAGAFFGFYTSSFEIFMNMVHSWQLDSATNLGVSSVIWIFGVIVFVVFVAGFMQMLSGGWKAIE